jgi:hypothetical protein
MGQLARVQPASAATVAALVGGIAVEGVDRVVLAGGGVTFSPVAGAGRQPYWGMQCLNATGSHVQVDAGWSCRNTSH